MKADAWLNVIYHALSCLETAVLTATRHLPLSFFQVPRLGAGPNEHLGVPEMVLESGRCRIEIFSYPIQGSSSSEMMSSMSMQTLSFNKFALLCREKGPQRSLYQVASHAQTQWTSRTIRVSSRTASAISLSGSVIGGKPEMTRS